MLLSDTLLQQFPVAWVVLSDDCIITDYNSDFSILVRTKDECLTGTSILELWAPEYKDDFLDGIDQLLGAKGQLAVLETTLNLPGRPVDLRLTGRALDAGTDAISVILTVVPLVQDALGATITPSPIDGKQNNYAEMVLRRGGTLMKSWIVAANQLAGDLTGQSKEVLTCGTLATVLKEDFTSRTWIAAEAAFHAGKPFHTTLVSRLDGGTYQLTDWYLSPCDPADPQGRFWLDQRLVRSQKNNAESRQFEQGLSLDTAQLGGETGIWSWDLLKNEFSFSPRLMASLGYDLAEVEDTISFNASLFHPEDLGAIDSVVQSAIDDRKPYRIVVRLKASDGQYRSILVRGQPVYDENGVPIRLVGTETEITEQIDLGKKLLRAEQIAKVGNWSRRLGEDDTYWSPELCRIHGQDPESYKPSLKTAHQNVHPDDLELVTHGELRVLKKWRLNPEMVDRIRVRILRPDGTVRHCEISTVVEVDADGNPFELVGTLQDISELVEAEQGLLRAQKMEVVGQLAGGAAHDFNNLLAVIMGNLELLEDEEDPDERIEYIHGALTATRRGGDLTRNLLSFARQAVLNPRRLDLNAVVIDLKKVLHRVLPESIHLKVKAGSDLWSSHADRSSFENAVLNLAINARDAMPDGGVITLETENIVLTETYVEERRDILEAGPYVVFSLTDTGTGMSPELMQDVFTPYFTTKSIDQGSGLGLSMVHGFARQSGGGLRLYSKVGMGTTVKLFFPASNLGSSTNTERGAEGLSGAVSGRVLLVESGEQPRHLTAGRLQRLGLNCTAVGNGDEAVILHTREGSFDLLVTDIVLPGSLRGPDLASRLRRLQPDLKVIYAESYAGEVANQGDAPHLKDAHLTKPVSEVDLTQAVYELMQT